MSNPDLALMDIAALAPMIAGGVAGIWNWRASFLVFAILAITITIASFRYRVEETNPAGPSAAAIDTPTRARTSGRCRYSSACGVHASSAAG